MQELLAQMDELAHAQGITRDEAILEAIALWIDQNAECIEPCAPWLALETGYGEAQ